jgi:hypothetical protein
MNSAWEVSNGAYWYRPAKNMRRIYLGRTRKDALATWEQVKAGAVPFVPLAGTKDDFGRILGQMFFSMRNRAVKRSIPFMTRAEIAQLWDRAAGRCEVSGVPFSLERLPGRVARPWAPSLDRVESSGDYRMGNCRIVCAAVNMAMNEWGHDVLLRVVQSMANFSGISQKLYSDARRTA